MDEQRARRIIAQTVDQYNRIAEDFDSKRSGSADFTALRQYVKQGDLVLDVGCGNGRLTDVLRGTGVNLIGTDASRELVAVAQQRYAEDIANNWVGFTVSDALDLPFDSHQFDVVFCMAVIHHIPSQELRRQLVKDVYEATKKHGKFVGSTWNLRADEFVERYTLSEQLAHPAAGMDVGDVQIPWKANGADEQRYCHAFTMDELRELFAHTGWRLDILEPVDRNFAPTTPEQGINLFWVATAE